VRICLTRVIFILIETIRSKMMTKVLNTRLKSQKRQLQTRKCLTLKIARQKKMMSSGKRTKKNQINSASANQTS